MSKQKELIQLNPNFSEELVKIDDKAQLTEVYHLVMNTARQFSQLSANIPKQLLEVVQHIHGRFDSCCYYITDAANTFDIEQKIKSLRQAKEDLFFQYNSFEYLVQTKAITIGAANNILIELKKSYEQLSKWFNSIQKSCK